MLENDEKSDEANSINNTLITSFNTIKNKLVLSNDD